MSWCFFQEGLPLPASTSKGFAYTPSGAAWFRKAGKWTTKPARGHVVFFDFPNDGVDRISHVGIVTGVNADGSIDTIEGNTDERGGRTGGKVMRRRRVVGIVGYGIPAYSSKPSIPKENLDVTYRYTFDNAVWTTNLVHRQHWESGSNGFVIMERHTVDLGVVPEDFHQSLTDAG